MGKRFNLNNAPEMTEFLYVAQHHGFQTPFLDWTESPYVASYFAFHQLGNDANSGFVRIFCFDKGAWFQNHHATLQSYDSPYPSIHPLIVTSPSNERALPQQSLVTFSNIYNIEEHIRFYGTQDERSYLTVIDIAKAERNSVMKDLEIMGITAASLFPGLDGICQAHKEKCF
ncbi:FRG domain-containing protein [Vibrio sp. kj40-1]|uniref:FRG domain-containing protein n=1 Tax=Vibrio algarum TaxID=3020714 RepID=A0ABT4YRR7_9VIBR|nr:FRG domain-containing protein [Vibrio sp. KJ40-1]